MNPENETTDNLDEAMILGYFEVIRGTFLTKVILLRMIGGKKGDQPVILRTSLQEEVIEEVKLSFPEEKLFYEALDLQNTELYLNYLEDILTSILVSSWIVFEQIIKQIPIPDYAHREDRFTADYRRRDFGFTLQEKVHLDLFYYFRNAIQHYNGAYYAASEVNTTFNGEVYDSRGHSGEKLFITFETAYKVAIELERLACKAWTNYRVSKRSEGVS